MIHPHDIGATRHTRVSQDREQLQRRHVPWEEERPSRVVLWLYPAFVAVFVGGPALAAIWAFMVMTS